MTKTIHQPQTDERAIVAGTTIRFVLLVALLLVSSGRMMLDVALGFYGEGDMSCVLAAGGDPSQNSSLYIGAIVHAPAFEACTASYQSSPPWWLTLVVWPTLLLIGAGLLFWGLPAWRTRRGRVVPLEAIDRDGALHRLLGELAAVAGLTRVPRVVVDPAAPSTGAVVFGRNGRPTVCLDGGLLARRRTDSPGFRAVLLHELAHIRNGDVTITYVTVSLWRVFLGLVLLPFLVRYITMFAHELGSTIGPNEEPVATRGLLLTVFLVVLVYLARADVLRSREMYADLAAVRWGADPRTWAARTPAAAGGAPRPAFGSFAELWRTHPRWDLRRDALTNPAALFAVPALPMFLAGAAAALINAHLWSLAQQYAQNNKWAEQAAALTAATLVSGVAGIALWRAVAHARLTARRAPSGVRAGLWLGAGMAAAELFVNRAVLFGWLPAQPAVLVLVVLAGVVFAWWTTQCAQLWSVVWPGRRIWTAMLPGLAAGCVALSAWFAWWQGVGAIIGHGWQVNPDGVRQLLMQGLSPDQVAEHYTALSAIAFGWPQLQTITYLPVVLSAVAVLWLMPLLAWVIPPAPVSPRWVRDAVGASGGVPPHGEGLPPLRRALLPGLLGGVLSWAVVVCVMAYMHTWQPPLGQRDVTTLLYQAWVFLALVAAVVTAAVIASVLASRYRLLIALIAAETAALAGFAGVFVLADMDGCVQPLNTLQSSCVVSPASIWLGFQHILGVILVLGALVAVFAAAAVSAIRRAWPPATQEPRAGRDGLLARRTCVGALCAMAVVITLAQEIPLVLKRPLEHAPAVGRIVPGDNTAVSAHTRAMQVIAWSRVGGWALMDRFAADARSLSEVLREAATVTKGAIDPARVRPFCDDLAQIARDADRFFPVPEPQAQSRWQEFIAQARESSADCGQALDHENGRLFLVAVREMTEAGDTLKAVKDRIGTVAHDGGF
ncbi:M48 family metallopeptidase [Saccharopolyspora sp. ASAGF58]|uniref:M48 family metallopeptidase n=1 Tax=Saccharopolyspora sp. ASAGF58 TaxID=2719023 RepID=UPI00143FF762|nr:M56 family metallopeptidase [Saccharopolyspora sp. ASAGF58]QIZ38807.1 hypothetical protein FDZ84_35320 [Saccharopolyspora sp. ASAGF58]